jgi:hypothetical protein
MVVTRSAASTKKTPTVVAKSKMIPTPSFREAASVSTHIVNRSLPLRKRPQRAAAVAAMKKMAAMAEDAYDME